MVEIFLNASDEAVLYMYYLVGLVSHTALVRHDDGGDTLLGVELLEQSHHLNARLRVQGSRGFVSQYDLWFGDECAGYGNTLLLSARHLVGIVVSPLSQSETVEIFHSQAVACAMADTLII